MFLYNTSETQNQKSASSLMGMLGSSHLLTFEHSLYQMLTNVTNGLYQGGSFQWYHDNGICWLVSNDRTTSYKTFVPTNYFQDDAMPIWLTSIAASQVIANHMIWKLADTDEYGARNWQTVWENGQNLIWSDENKCGFTEKQREQLYGFMD